MKIEILASGSKGNVTAVRSGENFLLLDCGKAFRWTIERLNYKLPDALLITHEHGDHAHAAKDFLKRGVEVYMTAGTGKALGLCARHNLHTIAAGEKFKVAGVEVTVIKSIHDAAEPVNFILQDADDRLLLLTDTGAVPDVDGDFTKILIEANYSTPILQSSDLNCWAKMRILKNHLSIEQAARFLKNYPNAEYHLIHISQRHGDGEKFYNYVRRIKNGARNEIGSGYGSLPLYAARRLQQFSKIQVHDGGGHVRQNQ